MIVRLLTPPKNLEKVRLLNLESYSDTSPNTVSLHVLTALACCASWRLLCVTYAMIARQGRSRCCLSIRLGGRWVAQGSSPQRRCSGGWRRRPRSVRQPRGTPRSPAPLPATRVAGWGKGHGHVLPMMFRVAPCAKMAPQWVSHVSPGLRA
jgi:hypothetical protein